MLTMKSVLVALVALVLAAPAGAAPPKPKPRPPTVDWPRFPACFESDTCGIQLHRIVRVQAKNRLM